MLLNMSLTRRMCYSWVLTAM
uniref:Uncharacterized protein n=1 Tax=Anguilla anguilla TaxID=7936 RepID=A0A0E9TSJ4_ANGAN